MKDEIKKVEVYEYDGEIYKTKEEAQAAINRSKNWLYLDIDYYPDLEEGKGYYEHTVLRIIPPSSMLEEGKERTIRYAIENVITGDERPYQAVQGFTDYRKTVLIKEWIGEKDNKDYPVPPIDCDKIHCYTEDQLEEDIREFLIDYDVIRGD